MIFCDTCTPCIYIYCAVVALHHRSSRTRRGDDGDSSPGLYAFDVDDEVDSAGGGAAVPPLPITGTVCCCRGVRAEDDTMSDLVR